MPKPAPQEEFFVNRSEAYDWLIANNFKVSSGKFYGDCKKGFPAINADKTVSRYHVAIYGQQLKEENTPDLSSIQTASYDHRKAKAEADMAEMKAEKMAREEDALWLHADDAWSAIAALIGNLRDAIRRELHDAQVDIIVAAGGEIARGPEVYEHIDGVVGRAFNGVAKRGIDVQTEEEK
jgi:aspartyl-tRNA synthetase